MVTLRIEHRISGYESWKKAFDSDPLHRKKSGVTAYRIYRPVDDDLFVIIELDFAHLEQADAMQSALHHMFDMIEEKLVFNARTHIYHMEEERM